LSRDALKMIPDDCSGYCIGDVLSSATLRALKLSPTETIVAVRAVGISSLVTVCELSDGGILTSSPMPSGFAREAEQIARAFARRLRLPIPNRFDHLATRLRAWPCRDACSRSEWIERLGALMALVYCLGARQFSRQDIYGGKNGPLILDWPRLVADPSVTSWDCRAIEQSILAHRVIEVLRNDAAVTASANGEPPYVAFVNRSDRAVQMSVLRPCDANVLCLAFARAYRATLDYVAARRCHGNKDYSRAHSYVALMRIHVGDLERQQWLLRAAMLHRQTGKQVYRYAVPEGRGELCDRQRLIENARRIADRILERAVTRRGVTCWLSVMPTGSSWRMTVLGADLYGGLPGVALFLAQVAALTKDGHYAEVAHRIITSVTALPVDGSVGGYFGAGGLIYSYLYLGLLWADQRLIGEAIGLAVACRGFVHKDDGLDIVNGCAGLLRACLALYQVTTDPRVLETAIAAGDRLRSAAVHEGGTSAWLSRVADVPLAGFAHGSGGIAVALQELAAATGQRRWSDLAKAALTHERQLYDGRHQNWRDLRMPAERQFTVAWCHGAAGVGLSRLMVRSLLNDPQCDAELETAIEATSAAPMGSNHGLCCGDLGNLDFLLSAALATKRTALLNFVLRRAWAIVEAISREGVTCGVVTPEKIEIPGLMKGISGVGYELLRIAHPDRVPSVLSMELPVASNGLPRRPARRAVAVPAHEGALPSLLLIGPPRTATSSLYRYLLLHDHLKGPLYRKEVRFFTEHRTSGLEWYRSQFPSTTPEQLVFDASPCYFAQADPDFVRRLLPETKLVVTIREPVSRAWSHYRHELRRGVMSLPIDSGEWLERCDSESDSGYLERTALIWPGFYALHIGRWLEAFGAPKVLIVMTESLKSNPSVVLREIASFIGVPDYSRPLETQMRNASPNVAVPRLFADRLGDLYARDWEEFQFRVGYDHLRVV
jgi:hypothetical protein